MGSSACIGRPVGASASFNISIYAKPTSLSPIHIEGEPIHIEGRRPSIHPTSIDLYGRARWGRE